MAGEPEKGDKVTWTYGSAQPSGEISEKKPDGKVEVTSHKGNKISRTAKPGDPAVAISRSGNDVVKNASDVKVTSKKRGAEEKGDKGEGKKVKTEEKAAPKKETKDAPKKEAPTKESKPKEAKPKGKGKVLKEEKPTRVSTRNKDKK